MVTRTERDACLSLVRSESPRLLEGGGAEEKVAAAPCRAVVVAGLVVKLQQLITAADMAAAVDALSATQFRGLIPPTRLRR
jgi:hypothetical protein